MMIFLAIVIAGYMAWNIGANDVANAMGTSVGSKALTLRNAIIIAAVFEFLGAFFAGDAVTDTVRKGVLVISEEKWIRCQPNSTTDLLQQCLQQHCGLP